MRIDNLVLMNCPFVHKKGLLTEKQEEAQIYFLLNLRGQYLILLLKDVYILQRIYIH